MSHKKTQPDTPAPEGESWIGNIIDRHTDAIAIAITVLTAFMALLLFNARMSEGGDDSSYICRALDFLAENRYPNYQGPLYPLFLAPFIALHGSVSVIALKFTSYALIILGQLAMYFSLRHDISRRLLLSVMLLMAVNLWFVQFGSLTYSEPLFIIFQWVLIWALLRLDSLAISQWKRVILWAVVAGLAIVLAVLVRTAGFGFAIAAIVFLLLRRHWVHALSIVASTAVIFSLWLVIRSAVWGDIKTDDRQLNSLLQVDPYDPNNGLETPHGFIQRFVGNSNLYLSKHYIKMLGLRDVDSREKSAPITVALYILFFYGAITAYKRNRGVLLIAVTAATMLSLTFFSLQTLWDQYRLILPYIALMHIVVFYAISDIIRRLARRHRLKIMATLVFLLSAILFSRSANQADVLTLRKNLLDDPLTGFTPDWYNYLSLCQSTANLPSDAYVACRKPNMARIYSGGRKFYGIYTIPSEDADQLVENLRSKGVTHIIVASLRRDPAQAGLGVINTIHRYLNTILKKYPLFLEQVEMCGTNETEPAALFRLHYENAQPASAQ